MFRGIKRQRKKKVPEIVEMNSNQYMYFKVSVRAEKIECQKDKEIKRNFHDFTDADITKTRREKDDRLNAWASLIASVYVKERIISAEGKDNYIMVDHIHRLKKRRRRKEAYIRRIKKRKISFNRRYQICSLYIEKGIDIWDENRHKSNHDTDNVMNLTTG